MKIKTSYECEVETISPVHIGSGEKTGLGDYVVDEEKIVVVDIDKLISTIPKPDDLTEEIESEGRNFRIEEFLRKQKIEAKSVEKYSIKWDSERSDREISAHIKNSFNQPYIPGSSIKGAIRTAILWYMMKGDGLIKEGQNAIKQGLDKMQRELNKSKNGRERGRIKKNWKKEIGKEIEKLVFYGKEKDAKYDVLKSLHVSDSNSVNLQNLEVSTVKIMSTSSPTTYGWKDFRKRRAVTNHSQATPSFVEVLEKGTNIEGVCIGVDAFLFKEEIKKEIGFNNEQQKDITDFAKICNEFAKELIEEEKLFYQNYGFKELFSFYGELEKKIPVNDAFLVHLGWGSGWRGMTVGTLLDFNLLKELRRQFRIGKTEPFIPEFPKTRKIVFENNQPTYPLGWAKIKIGN